MGPIKPEDVWKERYRRRNKRSNNKCKTCESDRVYKVGYSEHCRACDNWQARF